MKQRVVSDRAEVLTLGNLPSVLFKGAGQVMFQGSAWCGVLFLVAIFWGSWLSGRLLVGVGAVVGLAVSTLTGYVLSLRDDDGREGLWGFN